MRVTKIITIVLIALILILFCVGTLAAVTSSNKAALVRDIFVHYNPNLFPEQARELSALVLQAGEKFDVDPFVLASIIVRESSAKPWVISKGGDYGLMQVRWRVHQKEIRRRYPQVRKDTDLLKPEINIFVGAEIFARYYAKQKTIRGALLRYSAGNKILADRVLKTIGKLEAKEESTFLR